VVALCSAALAHHRRCLVVVVVIECSTGVQSLAIRARQDDNDDDDGGLTAFRFGPSPADDDDGHILWLRGMRQYMTTCGLCWRDRHRPHRRVGVAAVSMLLL
jgi:hypothetical protein